MNFHINYDRGVLIFLHDRELYEIELPAPAMLYRLALGLAVCEPKPQGMKLPASLFEDVLNEIDKTGPQELRDRVNRIGAKMLKRFYPN